MDDIIKGLQILRKYSGDKYVAGLYAEHDVLYVGVNPDEVSVEDKATLEELGFFPNNEESFEYLT